MRKISERANRVQMSGIRKFFQAAKPNAVNLAIGQPDFDTPEHIKAAAKDAIDKGLTGYTNNTGVPELREAISDKFKRENDLDYSEERILVTAGAGEALFIATESIVDKGDRVLITDPGFVSYEACTTLAGGKPDFIPLNDSMHIDIDAASEKIKGARLLILNTPCNPTGMVESESSIKALVEIAMDAGVTVLSDEVYEHFIYGKKHVSAAKFGEDVITVNAASKTYAMTGWRLGFLGAPDDYYEQCLKVHQYCQTCAASISQYAGIAAYTGDQTCVKTMRDEYECRRNLISDGLNHLGIKFPKPEGAFYAFVPMDKEKIQQVLEANVVVVPGDAFGTACSNYARFSYAASREQLKLALERITPVFMN